MPSWFPNFLNVGPAAIAASVVIPSLLILYFLKLRRREMAVPSTLLWKKAIQDLQVNAPFQRLRKNLLLLLQMLLLILLLLALARPVVSFTPGAGKLNVFLIDRSASMTARDIDGKSRLDEAKRRAKAQVETMDKNATGMVIAFDETAEAVQSFTGDIALLKRAIDTIQPTHRKSRLKTAYQLAEAQSSYFLPGENRATGPRPTVWLYSDGRVQDADEADIHAEVKYDKVGTDDAPNIAIVAMSAKRNYERPTEVQVFARLANFGPAPTDTDVQLSIDGQVTGVKTNLKLAPERWMDPKWAAAHPGQKDDAFVPRDSVEFKLELASAAVIKLEQMNKQADVMAADDAAWLIVPPPKQLHVLLVSDGNFFLERALESLSIQKPAVMPPMEYEQKVPAEYDVILFDRYSPQKLPAAGNFIYFGGVAAGIKLQPVLADGQPVILKDVGVLDWKRDHPILRHLALSRLFTQEMVKLQVPQNAEVLVDGIKGPMIVLYREGRSTHLVVAFDLLPSNWPLKPSFPMFVHYALQYMALGSEMQVRQSLDPGATPQIPRPNLLRADKDIKTITVAGPGPTRKVTVPESGDVVLPSLDLVGLYKLDPPVPGYEELAVNLLDASESDTLPADAPGGGEVVEAVGKGRGRLELWWWAVVAAGGLLAVEWWVYTRRVHL